MKSIILLSTLFFSMLINSEKNDYISIEYVGDGAKPLHAIYISTKPIPEAEQVITIVYSEVPLNYIVTAKEFFFIRSKIALTSKKTFEEKDYYGVKIAIRKDGSIKSYFITQKNSNTLFLKINAYLQNHRNNKDLILHINYIREAGLFYGGSAPSPRLPQASSLVARR